MGVIGGPPPSDDAAMTEPDFPAPSERDSLEESLYGPLSKDRTCFYCGKELSAYPIVYWSGGSSRTGAARRLIFLHPACASGLGSHLMQDASRVPPRLGPAAR